MAYQIIAKVNGQKQSKRVNGVRELHTSLTSYRSQGFKIAKISRVV
jgi:hypothetical protein